MRDRLGTDRQEALPHLSVSQSQTEPSADLSHSLSDDVETPSQFTVKPAALVTTEQTHPSASFYQVYVIYTMSATTLMFDKLSLTVTTTAEPLRVYTIPYSEWPSLKQSVMHGLNNCPALLTQTVSQLKLVQTVVAATEEHVSVTQGPKTILCDKFVFITRCTRRPFSLSSP